MTSFVAQVLPHCLCQYLACDCVYRVLSEELPSLKTLSVCSCGLEDLDGITYTPNLVSLIAADNRYDHSQKIQQININLLISDGLKFVLALASSLFVTRTESFANFVRVSLGMVWL